MKMKMNTTNIVVSIIFIIALIFNGIVAIAIFYACCKKEEVEVEIEIEHSSNTIITIKKINSKMN